MIQELDGHRLCLGVERQARNQQHTRLALIGSYTHTRKKKEKKYNCPPKFQRKENVNAFNDEMVKLDHK